jgi:hypothetical protein
MPGLGQMRQDAEFRFLEAASDRAGALATKPGAVHYRPARKAAAKRPVRNEPKRSPMQVDRRSSDRRTGLHRP